MKSWRTTALGILTVLGAVVGVLQAMLDGNPATNPDWMTQGAAIMAGLGLVAAKDHKNL